MRPGRWRALLPWGARAAWAAGVVWGRWIGSWSRSAVWEGGGGRRSLAASSSPRLVP